MRISTRTRGGRAGFTLVELLVAAALSILIMAVLSTAFQTGLQTLSTLKSLGDMAERLKTAETLLRTDLAAEHFATVGNSTGTPGDGSPGALRVSDLRFDSAPPGGLPLGGYFQILQALGSSVEGSDADGLISTRADGHRLSMTVKRTGRTPEQLFTADLSQLTPGDQTNVSAQSTSDVGVGTRLVSEWAQVDWFLDPRPPLNGVPTWALIRRVRVLGAQPLGAPPLILSTPATTAGDVLSLNPTTNALHTIQTIAIPANRSPVGPITNPAKVGDDIVITNVLSFEVRPMYTAATGPGGVALPPSPDGIFQDLPLPIAPGSPREFDTGLPATGNNRIRVLAVQVKIRVYDPKNKLTRQTTLVVKL